MNINQIEPTFKKLEARVEELEAQLETHVLDPLPKAHPIPVEDPAPGVQDWTPVEKDDEGNSVGSPEQEELKKQEPVVEAASEDPPPPTKQIAEESEDVDARFRQEVDDSPVLKVDIQTNVSESERVIIEDAVAKTLAELKEKGVINTKVNMTNG